MTVVLETVEGLAAALDALGAVDPERLADGDTVVALHRQLERLAALATRVDSAFEAGGAWEADGARTAAAWVAAKCRLPIATTRSRMHLGRCLRSMHTVEAAWLAGDIAEPHARLFAAVRTPATARCFERDEAMLVEQARTLRYASFARALAYWAIRADPEGAEASAAAQHRQRHLHLSQTFGGSWALDGLLDPINGAVVATMLGRIEEELFSADWAEARSRVGETVSTADLARTPAQRRADALVEMARRAQAVPTGARMPEPLFSVLVGYDAFSRVCELANGTVITPGALVPWIDQAWVERIVFDGPDRVTNVGVRRRIFSGATRRAVEVRDRTCFHAFCDDQAEHCQVDHVQPWSAGGLTTTDNGRLACGFHNRLRHRRRGPP